MNSIMNLMTRNFSKTFIMIFLFSVAGTAVQTRVAQAADPQKIGVVDIQEAIQSVNEGKSARSKLEKEVEKKKAELQKEESSIKKMNEEFQKQAMVLNEKARTKKQNELQERMMKFRETAGRSQMELQKKEQELTQPILEKMRSIIEEMAKQKGYDIVLEKTTAGVVFSTGKDDLTEELVKAYNSKK